MINPQNVSLLTLPYVPFKYAKGIKNLLPRTSAIYFCLLENNFPCYIGETIDLHYRFFGHSHSIYFKKTCLSKLSWLSLPKWTKKREMQTIEKSFVHYYYPPLNFQWWRSSRKINTANAKRKMREKRFGIENETFLQNTEEIAGILKFFQEQTLEIDLGVNFDKSC